MCWPLAFRDARDIDEFVDIFTKHIQANIEAANHTHQRRRFGTPDLLKCIINLIHKKKAIQKFRLQYLSISKK